MGKNEREHSIVYAKKLNIINIDLNKFKEDHFENLYQKSSLFNTKEFSNAFCKALNDMLLHVNKNYK